MTKQGIKILISIIILICSIITGFIALALVYRGSVIKELIVFFIVVIILIGLIKKLKPLLKNLENNSSDSPKK